MSMELSRERAAQAWCKPTTKHKEMDPDLAEAFAEILEDVWSRPWLGNATTKELLTEVYARVDLNYRTVKELLTEVGARVDLNYRTVDDEESDEVMG
jgi:hypothetical protein